MGMLILKKDRKMRKDMVIYHVFRQSEIFRCSPSTRGSGRGYLRLGTHGGVAFASADSPQYYGPGEHNSHESRAFYLRGMDSNMDGRDITVPREDQEIFEKAVLAYNQENSNNKLDMEDVIWPEDD